MIGDKYSIEFGADFRVFEFDSEGLKGKIRKIVQYSQINQNNFYNLGFGDKNPDTDTIDDLVVTNNADSQKILLTVASTLYVFTDYYPNAFVVAVGSTLSRTRLYRIGITRNLEFIEKDFYVYGLQHNNWQSFKKGIEYDAFLVRRKS
jgi:hypothetical protein